MSATTTYPNLTTTGSELGNTTPPSPPTAATPAPRTNLGAALRDEVANLWADDAPSEPAASPPADSAERDGDAAPTRADEPDKTPKLAANRRTGETAQATQAAEAPAPAPETAPETVTLTAAELATLRRQAADQSVTAKRLVEANRRLQLTEQARVASLGEIAQKWDHPEVKAAALEEMVRGDNYVRNALADDERQTTAANDAFAQLDRNKVAAAQGIYDRMTLPLHRESAALGIPESELNQIIAEIKAKHPKVVRFEGKFAAARTIEDATDAADSAYELLGEAVMARLQDRKIAALKDPEDEKKSETKTTRTHAFGGGNGAVAADPYAHLTVEQRARNHTRDGLAADMAAIWQQE